MREAAVIGEPISHSRSPELFSKLAQLEGVSDFHYEALKILPSELSVFVGSKRAEKDFLGCNVTIPHKETVLKSLDQPEDLISPEVTITGAANVLKFFSGKISAFNTDVSGIIQALKSAHCEVQGESVLVWGVGGAARAAAFALGKLGAKEITFIERQTSDRGKLLIHQISPHFPSTHYQCGHTLSLAHNAPFKLAINATPVGMNSNKPRHTAVDSVFHPLLDFSFQEKAYAFDMVYNPAWTDFLQTGAARGLIPIFGLDMLIFQALATWEIWVGKLKNLEATKKLLEAHFQKKSAILRDERPIWLTGFMGAGKSIVSRMLADILGWQWVDTDQKVEEEAGCNISELFKWAGEPAFRKTEKSVVRTMAARPRTVIALGGGAILDDESLALVKRAGHLVFLEASFATLQERIARRPGVRPLAQDPKINLKELFDRRLPHYEKAHFKVQIDSKSPKTIAQEILEQLRGHP